MSKIIITIFIYYLFTISLYSNVESRSSIVEKEDARNTQKPSTIKCIKLKKVTISNSSLLSADEKKEIVNNYIGECIDSDLLKAIIKDLSNHFMENGYITTKPYLKEQNILDGQLDINIIEGIVENIVDKKTKKSKTNLKTAFILQKNKPLNLRELETALEMINRVPSVDAKLDIKPSETVGKSIVEVNTTKTTPVHLTLGIDGEKSFNDHNPDLTAIFSLDNPLNINDILSITYNGSRIQKEYQSTKGKEINYSFPLGSYLYEIIFSNTQYRQGISGIEQIYKVNGETDGKKLKISKVVYRNQNNKLNIVGMLYHKDSTNYFADKLIEISSYKTTLLELDLLHTYLQSWGQLNTTFSYYQGLDWFGARSDSYNRWEIDHQYYSKFQFKKYTLESNLYYKLANSSYSINSLLHFQYTNDYLYNNDQLTVGSSSTVRGYSDSNLFGNNGWYIQNNLTKSISFQNKLIEQLSLSLGFDYGQIRCEKDNINSCGNIHGASIALMTSSENFNTEFRFSKPLKSLTDNFDNKEIFNYSFTIKF